MRPTTKSNSDDRATIKLASQTQLTKSEAVRKGCGETLVSPLGGLGASPPIKLMLPTDKLKEGSTKKAIQK